MLLEQLIKPIKYYPSIINSLPTNFTHAQKHTVTKLFLWFLGEKKYKAGDVNAHAFARSRVSMLCSTKSQKLRRECCPKSCHHIGKLVAKSRSRATFTFLCLLTEFDCVLSWGSLSLKVSFI